MAEGLVVSRRRRRKAPSTIRIEGRLAYVSLTKGLEAVIDVPDIPKVERYRWFTLRCKSGHRYAARVEGGRCFLMHRQLVQPRGRRQVGHKDGDSLNNQRRNLLAVKPGFNQAKRSADPRSKIGLRGVSFSRSGRRYRASITPNGKKRWLGSFATKEEAAATYRAAAKALWGDFAPTD